MSRHKHKNNQQDTKAALATVQEARKATQEIKAELIEHKNLIKLHVREDISGKADENDTSIPAASDSATIGKKHFDQTEKVNDKQDAQSSRQPDALTEQSHNMRSLLESWTNIQFQMNRMVFSVWLEMLQKGTTPS